MPTRRIDWIDYAKGLCILLFVMLQTTLVYEARFGTVSWMHYLAAWAAPFAVPTLFLIAGLFLNRTLFGSKSAFFDRKILRFVYFYAIWLAIQTVLLNPAALVQAPSSLLAAYATSWVQPSEGLWILPLLVVFSGVSWLLRYVSVPRLLIMAAVLQIMHAAGLVHSGWILADRFAEYFVFFYAGYAGIGIIRRFAAAITVGFDDVAAALLVWAAINTVIVLQGTAHLPIISLVMGIAGAFAVMAASTVLMRHDWNWAAPVKYAGRHYLVIYLACYLPLSAGLWLAASAGVSPEPGLAILALSVLSVLAPLGLHRLVRRTPLRALYRRPPLFRLKAAERINSASLLTPPKGAREA